MTVLLVRNVSLVGLKSDTAALMAALEEAEVLHINMQSGASQAVDEREIAREEERVSNLAQAISYLKRFCASSSAIPPKCKDPLEAFDRVSHLVMRLQGIEGTLKDLEETIETYRPFGRFNQDLGELSAMGITMRLAVVSGEELDEAKRRGLALQIFKNEGDVYWIALLLYQQEEAPFTTFDVPQGSMSALEQRVKTLKSDRAQVQGELSRWHYQLHALERLSHEAQDHLRRLLEMRKLSSCEELVGLSGFVLETNEETLKKSLSRFVVGLRIEDPKPEDDVPVALKNSRAIVGFESIVKAFSGINYFEKDKTPIVFVLFLIFGSLCFIDAGYGLLLMMLGYVIHIKKSRAFGQVFMWTGACATLTGLLCGQFFGLIFGKDILVTTPPLVPLAEDALACFYFSLIVGLLVMVLTNMVIINQKGFKSNATGNIFALFALSIAVVAKSGVIAADNLMLCSQVAVLLALISWVMFPENVFGTNHTANVLWTFYSGPIGLIGDILSHMRLFGISLSGAILALVINKIASMMPVLVGFPFALVGHFFVFLLSLLSLYIHTNRLIFLEFGSKCITGGHRYFTPFARRLS